MICLDYADNLFNIVGFGKQVWKIGVILIKILRGAVYFIWRRSILFKQPQLKLNIMDMIENIHYTYEIIYKTYKE